MAQTVNIIATRHPSRRTAARWVAVTASALLLLCAFPPISLDFMAWVALVPFYLVWRSRSRPIQAYGWGYLFGLFFFGGLTYWIGLTVTAWSQSPVGWVAWALLAIVEANWFGFFSALAFWLAKACNGLRPPLVFVCIWIMTEWLRTQGTYGLPWGLIGSTQYLHPILIQPADLAGIYSISFLVVLVNVTVAEYLLAKSLRNPLIWISSAVILIAVLYSAVRLASPAIGVPFRVAIMQGNFRNWLVSWQDVQRETKRIARMTYSVQNQHPNLILWSESAAPGDAINNNDVHQLFATLARHAHTDILVGSRYRNPDNGRQTNSAVLFNSNGQIAGRYDKEQIVPFGEFIPFRAYMPFGNIFHFFKTDLTPGQSAAPLLDPPARLGVVICFESTFPRLARARVKAGANVLISMTNDSWSGSIGEPEQHLALSIFRAVENDRDMLHASTGGRSACVDAEGRIVAQTGYFKPATLLVTARLHDGETIYSRFGNWFVLLCGLYILCLVISSIQRPARHATN